MKEPTRRRLLALAGGAAVATTGAIGGCLDDGTPAGSSGDDGTDDDGSDGDDGDETDGDGSDGSDGDGSDGDDDRPVTKACPPFGDRVERVICYDEIDPDEMPIFLKPSAATVERGKPIDFALENGTDDPLQINFYAWQVQKRVDGEWFHVAPREHPDPLMTLAPGEEHVWTVTMTAEGAEAGEPVRRGSDTDEVTIDGVGAGRYAFGAAGWFEGESYEEKTGFAAAFDLQGEPLEVTPSNAVESVDWDGETLVVRTNRGDPDDDRQRLGAYELERVDDPDEEPRRVIAEQVVANEQLRDALALAIEREANRVRLEEYSGWTPIFGVQEPFAIEFRGSTYRVTARELEE